MALLPSRTYLQLCQDMCSDLGITGGTMPSTQGITSQEQLRVANWIARADILIQQVWADWDFMYLTDSITGVAGNDYLVANNNFNAVDQKSMVYSPDVTGTNPQFPKYMDWRPFQNQFQDRPKMTQAIPTFWTLDPTKKIWLSHILLANAPFNLSYWKTPVRMASDTATSPIPQDFDTIIVERAKLLYAQRENAPEILSGSSAEYTDLLDKLQSAYLPNRKADRRSRNDDTTNPDGYVV
jgi:hypothetical protein